MGCTFLVTDDYSDCEMTTTTSTSTTTTMEPGCCYGTNSKFNDMCGEKVGRAACERSSQCAFRAGADADCEIYSTTQEAKGCCNGDGYKSNGRCLKATDQARCESNGCSWLET